MSDLIVRSDMAGQISISTGRPKDNSTCVIRSITQSVVEEDAGHDWANRVTAKAKGGFRLP